MHRLRKFIGLPPADRRLLIQAAMLLVAIRLGLWLLRFQSLHHLTARFTRAPIRLQEADQAAIQRIAWAVATVSRYMPTAPTCLIQAMATQVLLRRRGYPASLRIGVALSPEGQLQAHAWVESEGRVVIDRLDDYVRYTPLPPLEEKGL